MAPIITLFLLLLIYGLLAVNPFYFGHAKVNIFLKSQRNFFSNQFLDNTYKISVICYEHYFY